MKPATLLLAVFLALGVACDGSDGAPDTSLGAWDLVSVEGEPVPVRISAGEVDSTFITGGRVHLDAGGAYADTVHFEIRDDAGAEYAGWVFGGHWSRDGDDIHVVSQYDESIAMNLSIENGRLVNPDTPWGVLVFERSDVE